MNRLIRILLATLTGLGLLFGVVAIGAPAAVAAMGRYVTPAKFNRVKLDMTMGRVHKIFGTAGKFDFIEAARPGKPAQQYRYYPATAKHIQATG